MIWFAREKEEMFTFALRRKHRPIGGKFGFVLDEA
jgi:hypothetical protein